MCRVPGLGDRVMLPDMHVSVGQTVTKYLLCMYARFVCVWQLNSSKHIGRNTCCAYTHRVHAALVPAFHIPFLKSKQPVPQCLICHTATWLVHPAIIGSAVYSQERGGTREQPNLKSNSRDNSHYRPGITDNGPRLPSQHLPSETKNLLWTLGF